MDTALGGSTLQAFGNWRSDCFRSYRDESRLNNYQGFAAKMAAVGSTNAQSQREFQLKLNARRALEANTARLTSCDHVRGAALEGELLKEVGNTWWDDGVCWRLVSVCTRTLTRTADGEPYLETHVVGVYVDHLQYPNAEAAPPKDLEWSTAAELLGWLREAHALRTGETAGGPVESA